MNITSQTSALPLATVVNPQTDSLRRDNVNREVISQPAAAAQSAAEKGVASDKDKAKTPGQQNEHIDFANLKKQAQENDSTINDSSEQDQNPSQESKQEKPDHDAQSFEDSKKIKALKQRDLEVRSHEFAHASVGGTYTSAPSFTFEVGPDGHKYATSGEVSVDLAKIDGNPRATIAKMQKVHAAALAPANPSSQDTKIAATAAKIITQAQSELYDLDIGDLHATKSTRDNFQPNAVLSQDQQNNYENQTNDFDAFINQTLDSQEEVTMARPAEVAARAVRIEDYYLMINQAYEKPSNSQFELTV